MGVVKRIEPFLRLQPNGYTCGPAALRHALLAYGRRVSVRRLAHLAGTEYHKGTDDRQLQQAAIEVGYRIRSELFTEPEPASSALKTYLRTGTPVLLCADRYEHWITAVACTGRHVWICDSARPGPVLQRYTWRQL